MASKSAKTSVLLRSAVFTGDALMLTAKIYEVRNTSDGPKVIEFTLYDKSYTTYIPEDKEE